MQLRLESHSAEATGTTLCSLSLAVNIEMCAYLYINMHLRLESHSAETAGTTICSLSLAVDTEMCVRVSVRVCMFMNQQAPKA